MNDDHLDVIIIGSGIGGLSCGALLAQYGLKVLVCESHTLPGGAAHGFQRQGYTFDSGPSLFSGLSFSPSPNPLRQVLDAIGEDLEWATYDTWGCCLPEGNFFTSVGADQFCEVVRDLRGESAVAQWRTLQQRMEPLKEAAIALPAAAIRFDLGVLQTVGRFIPQLLKQLPRLAQLTGPFSQVIQGQVTDEFLLNWLDLMSFLLAGLPADGIIAAEMAFMFGEWYRPDVVLDYPMGGSGAIAEALLRGLTKQGGQIRFSSHVEKILIENHRAVGVRLRTGEELRCCQAVISNASFWDTAALLPASHSRHRQKQTLPDCPSFMHLHLGIDGQNLPSDLACHYIVVNDWQQGVTAPQNVVLVSIPSLLDSSLAPDNKHVIHVYTPGNEPYDLWQGLDRKSPDYAQLKQQRAEVMWQALERIIPDIRVRCEVSLVGTPLTHERFLRRHRGTYGPGIRAGTGLFPGPKTKIPGLLCCGDSTFPGIGMPAVAASGFLAAHALVPAHQQLELLQRIGCGA